MKASISQILEENLSFSECIITEISFYNFGENIHIFIDSIYENKIIRKDLYKEKTFLIVIKGVSVFKYINMLNEDQRSHVNWSAMEISGLFISDNETKLRLEWEGDERSIYIEGSEISILDLS